MSTPLKTLGLVMIASIAFTGCKKFTQTKVYTANEPVYLSYEDLRSSVESDNDRALVRPGKILVTDRYIFINDYEAGIHVYNNTNPSSPEHVGFINIPGNVDMAVKDNTLYADSYIDIVSIDISDPSNIAEISRTDDALSYTIPSTMDYSYPVSDIDRNKGVVTGYKVGEVEEKCANDECGSSYYNAVTVNQGAWTGSMMSEDGTVVDFADNSNNVRSVAQSSTQGAVSGSMSRFMMVEDHLYVISDQSTVKVYSASDNGLSLASEFSPWSDASGWGEIETLFKLNNNLFIGSTTGILIYNVENPGSPEYISDYEHMTSCDPVVANDDYAFITLRSGVECGRVDIDQLDIINIEDIMNPYFINSVSLSNPHGLSIDDENDLLFVCDGPNGMNVYNVTDPNGVVALATRSGDAYDAIANNNTLQVIGEGGLVQYSYDASGALIELSRIDLD